MTETAPAFVLRDMAGESRAFPTGRPSLIAFVKEDCHTCNLAAPVLEAFHQAWGDSADIWMVGQAADGNAILRDRHGLTLPILDDSALRASLAWGFEIVPAVYWTGPDGAPRPPLEGFVRAEWEKLAQTIAGDLSAPPAAVSWADLPDWRPGCGSKHLDPEIHHRLLAEAEGSPIRARRIEIAAADDIEEFMFDQGFSDGLPLVPPTPERVLRMLSGTIRDPQDIVAIVPPNMAPASVEKIAINAVMAGCKPEYLPVVIAAVEAVCTDEFNAHGVNATTMGATPVLVINGPIRERIGMNMRLAALGNGNRANATIGRALRLVIRNLGGARPGGVDRSTLSNPMKFTMCFAEWEEGSPWEPLHVERGFQREDSVVTAFAMTSGPVQIVDQESRKPDQIAGTLGLGLEGMFLPKIRRMPTDALLVVCPEHIQTLTVDGPYSKQRLRERIQAVTARPMREMVANEVSGAGIPLASAAKMTEAQLAAPVGKFADGKFIHIVVAGADAGKFSAAFHGWVTGPMGSTVVSRKIDC
jgi:hypothetical protein